MARPRPFRAEGRLAAIVPFAAGVLRSVPSRDGPVPAAAHPALAPMIAGRVNEGLIRAHWPDILRLAASMAPRRILPFTSAAS